MTYTHRAGIIKQAHWHESPNFDQRDAGFDVSALIVHCISLPPGQYGGDQIRRFFLNQLNAEEDSYFKSMAHLTVSAHFLVDRHGVLHQFVNTEQRAWHAGESVCGEIPKVNNYSIGVELEGWDEDPDGYTQAQYQALAALYIELAAHYPKLNPRRIFAHSDIAPCRKPDPGRYFEWPLLMSLIDDMSS